MKKLIIQLTLIITHTSFLRPCQCPIIEWSKELASQNEVIFRGIIKNIFLHQNQYTVAELEVKNLFKGNPYPFYKVLFPENDECAVPLHIGEEWIIYGKQKQFNSCEVKWCGWSRKKFQNDNEDFFITTHIITYDEEFLLLQKSFPEIAINSTLNNYAFHKNKLPDKLELYIYLALSFIGFLIILYLSKKYIK